MKSGNMLALVASLVLLGAGHLVSAQTQADTANPPAARMPDRGRGPGRRGGFEHPKLNLTADQKTKLKSLHESVRPQIEAVRNDATLSADDKRAKIRSLRESTRQQFRTVLTPEQQQLLQNERRGLRGRGERRGFGEGRGPRVDPGLTADQRSQLETIHQSTRDQLRAIRSDSTLSSEQKEAKLKSLLQNSHQQVSTILTPEQQQKLRVGHRGGPGRFGGRGRHRVPDGGGPPPAKP
jgi:Spy/CpxP family protein refolding chaperone